MKSHERGDATEARVIAELKQRGIPVAIPFSDNQRYDIIVETPAAELPKNEEKAWPFTAGMTPTTRPQATLASTAGYSTEEGNTNNYVNKNSMLTCAESGRHSDTESEYHQSLASP